MQVKWRTPGDREANGRETATTRGTSPAPRAGDVNKIARGTHAVVVRHESDLPFRAFAAVILPTLEQVRSIARVPAADYSAMQASAHAQALKTILGDEFDAAREYTVRSFIEEWALKRHRVHEEYVRRADSALSVHPAGDALDSALAAIARDWAKEYADLKLKKQAWLGDAFPRSSFGAHEDAIRRLGRHSEIAAAIRAKDEAE